MNQPVLWRNGKRVSREDARVDVLAHGLHYGTGVFEGIRSYNANGKAAIFQLEAHMERFARGTAALQMDVDVDEITRAIVQTVGESGFKDAYIRPLAFFASGGLGLDSGALTPESAVAVMPWKSHLGEDANARGVRVFVSSYRRNPHTSLPALKISGGYVNSVLAKREAFLAGFDEALFVDDEGYVCEATGENVFVVKDGRVTAVEHRDALPGITRDTVMTLTGAVARPVHLEELLGADEVFLTGTSAEVVPVSAIGAREYGTSPVTLDLQQSYLDLVHGRDLAHRSWLTAA